MSSFQTQKRERFLNEETYRIFRQGRRAKIDQNLQLLADELPQHAPETNAYKSWSWGVASGTFQLLLGAYSAGEPIEQIAAAFETTLSAIEASAMPHSTYRTEPFYLDEPDTYAYAMWLLSLTKLLRLDYLVPRVTALFNVARDENRGKDALFEALVAKLGESSEPAKGTLKSMKAHAVLLQVIEAEPAKRSKLMAEFLDKWYSSMKACYWYGLHTKAPQNFFGYWAFEAGLVTYLWDIDDTSYRSMPFYPKDLVAYARTHDAAVPSATPEQPLPKRQGVPAGLPCPESGFWFTPAKANSRRYFTQGEVLPDIKTDFGSTIWQWDSNQSPPKL